MAFNTSFISPKRSRSLTDKGRQYKIGILQEKRRNLEKKIKLQITELEEDFKSEVNRQEFLKKFEELNILFESFMKIHAQCQVLMTSQDVTAEDQVDVIDRKMFKLRKDIRCWLSEEAESKAGIKMGSQAETKRSSKRSNKSGSSRSSMELKVKEERARMAELKIESEFLPKQQEAELAKKQLQLKIEMAKASAKLKIYEEDNEEEEEDHLLERKEVRQEEKMQRVEQYLEDISSPKRRTEVEDIDSNKKSLISPINQLTDLVSRMQAPEVDLDIFQGDPLEYLYFITTFSEVVETKIQDERGRLTRLLKYLSGEPKELVSSCVYLSKNCYKEAKSMLKEKYGDPYKIMSAYRKEIRQWARLKPNDSSSFSKFHTFLVRFKCTMKYSGNSWYDSPDLIQLLHSKLPTYLQDRWNRQALKVRKVTGKEANLDDFLELLQREVDLVSDPLYSREASQNINQGENEKNPKKVRKVFLSNPSSLCPLCSRYHDLDDCNDYLKKTIDERKTFLFRSRLCFACYQPSNSEHTAKTCTNKRICNTCKGKHPSGLHGFVKKPVLNPPISEKPITSSCTSLKGNVISLCVVPVKLYNKDGTSYVSTHALLDNGSQGSFIKEDVKHQLRVKGITTNISIKTLAGETESKSEAIYGLQVSGVKGTMQKLKLPVCYSQEELPVDQKEVPTPRKISRWKYLDAIKELIPQDRDEIKIGILIGGNCPLALEPIEVISSKDGGPYAYKTKLGWCVMGPIHDVSSSKLTCNKIAVRNIADQSIATHYFCVPQEVKDQSLTKMLTRIYEHDFNENGDSSLINLTSQEDLKFLNIMEKNVVMKDGHYQLPLPFRNPDVEFVNNRSHVLQRANWLKNKLLKNGKMLDDYRDFMNNLLKEGYAVPTPSSQLKSPKGKGWYIPHFGVYHPMKPGKIRVVFDCSATSSGMSLNKELMQGPDLTSKLIGVLNRFRLEDVGIMADIEAMFYQVQIPEEHRTFLRFLWWPDGNLHNDLVEYQMTVHLFGAASSPSCSNFALRKTAEDNVDMGNDISTTLLRNFYVDDMLKSCEDPKQAIDLLQDVKKMCRRGGFNLTKIISSSRKVLESIDKKDHGKALRNLDLNSAVILPVERALGVQWCVENDSFGFRIQLQDRPLTKRGILSTVSSVYDPLGFAAPFLLTGRLLLQQLSADKKGWDEEPTSEQRATWEKWRSELPGLESIQIRRCFKPKNFGNVVNVSVHHFSDASDKGYGEASYLRLENEKGMVNCCLLMGKSRVAPLKTVTIPRLELTAATVSIKVGLLLARELDFQDVETFYWTDSKVVLGYLKNERRRFHLFVTNRVTMILDNSTKEQWRYVESRNNPADDASRGLTINQYLKNERWFNGPSFLQQPLDKILSTKVGKFDVHDEDPEVKRTVKVVNIITSEDFLSTLTSRTSKWSKLKRIVATILSWRTLKRGQVDVDGLVKAEKVILKLVQFKSYGKEVSTLTKEKKTMGLEKTSSLYTLNPYLDGDGIMRVGGRLSRSHIQDLNTIHPIILPSKSNVTLMLARECHEKVQHSGRGFTINEIRRRGYWIVRCNSFVRGLISKCVSCRWLRGKTATQKMANLPTDRIDEQPPFTVCGVDFFGPFFIKDGRKEVKRYGAMFTCFLTRAVHIESSNTLDTDSFIQALRRFIARRGNVRTLRCDNGTNFVGAETELHKALKEMDDEKVSSFLQLHGGDWINWRRNPPSSSHFGGVWERQIRTARSILSALLRTHGNSLNDESFRTLLVEVEGIVNSRPLTVETLSDVNSAIPLSPSNLLTMKSTVIIPPPGNITGADLYSRRRWRRIQHIANEFWARWRKEYLQTLQKRSIWQTKQRCFQVGDVVILKGQDEIRCEWKLARVKNVVRDKDGLVRSVTIRTSSGQMLDRPIHKLVLLVENDEGNSPTRSLEH